MNSSGRDQRATLGAEPDWTMVGTLFIGYPARPSASMRTPALCVTVWC